MNKFRYYLITSLHYLYLGGALSCFANLGVFKWEFHAIIIPFAIIDCVVQNYKTKDILADLAQLRQIIEDSKVKND